MRKCWRCWFTVYGEVGHRTPRCLRCGRPNLYWAAYVNGPIHGGVPCCDRDREAFLAAVIQEPVS